MRDRSEFQVRVLAELVGTNPRRVEGWVEKGFLTPVVRGNGPGRRRVFDLANLLEAALLVELLSTFGDRSRAVGRIVREVSRRLKNDTKRLVARLAVEEGILLTFENTLEILWIELERKGGVHVHLTEQTPEVWREAGRALGESRTVILLNVTSVLNNLQIKLHHLRN